MLAHHVAISCPRQPQRDKLCYLRFQIGAEGYCATENGRFYLPTTDGVSNLSRAFLDWVHLLCFIRKSF